MTYPTQILILLAQSKGWYAITQTKSQEVAKSRGQRFNDCVAAAKNSTSSPYTVPTGYCSLVITSPGVDEWGSDGAAFLIETIDVTGLCTKQRPKLQIISALTDVRKQAYKWKQDRIY
jgi:hypothetical protein